MIEANHPNLRGLVELASRDGVDIRPTLLRVMTDLYVQKPVHSPQEEQQFTELALRLIELVDAKTRAIVAAKIAGYPAAPTAVRRRMLKEHIVVTAPDRQQRGALQKPPAASPVATPVAIPSADELSELFLVAGSEERRLILLNLPYAPISPATVIPPAIARESAHRLEAAALGHNSELFAREIERTLLISREHARRLIDDPSGEPIVVVALALGMPAAELQRILLCLNPAIGQSVQRVYELALLHEEVRRDAAFRLVALWQAAYRPERKPAAPRRPNYQAQLWDDDGERAPPAARAKIRWDDFARGRKAEGG